MEEYSARNLESIAHAIENSRHIVCLLGRDVSADCGCFNYRDSEGAYAVELGYGYAPEEIFSAAFYNTRPKLFFAFYHNEILDRLGEPGEEFRVLKKMEDDRKVFAVITRSIYGLSRRAGIRNVVEMHGSVYENRCPHCGRWFDLDFVKSTPGVPFCPDCGSVVRPQIVLDGEMISNERVTASANEVSRADTLLILGSSLRTILVRNVIKYFGGSRIILINEEEDYSDSVADLVCHGKPRDVLPKIYR